MKKSSVVIFFLSFVLWAEFAGAIVYRNLVNENSRKEDGGPESNYLNGENSKNRIEGFDRQGDKIDSAGEGHGMIANQDEEQGVAEMGKDEGYGQGDVGSREKAEAGVSEGGMQDSLVDAIENESTVEEGKGTCTCGEQGGKGGEDGQGDSGDGSGQGKENQKGDLDDVTEENGEQNYIESATGDDKVGDENEEIESKHPDSEVEEEDAVTTCRESDEKGGMGGESETAISTDIKVNGEQDDSVDTRVQTIRFSPLDR